MRKKAVSTPVLPADFAELFLEFPTDPVPSPESLLEEGADIQGIQRRAIQRFVLTCLDLFPEDDPKATLEGKLRRDYVSKIASLTLKSQGKVVDVTPHPESEVFALNDYSHGFWLFPVLMFVRVFSRGPMNREEWQSAVRSMYDKAFAPGEFDTWQAWRLARQESRRIDAVLPETIPARLSSARL